MWIKVTIVALLRLHERLLVEQETFPRKWIRQSYPDFSLSMSCCSLPALSKRKTYGLFEINTAVDISDWKTWFRADFTISKIAIRYYLSPSCFQWSAGSPATKDQQEASSPCEHLPSRRKSYVICGACPENVRNGPVYLAGYKIEHSLGDLSFDQSPPHHGFSIYWVGFLFFPV